MEISKVRLPCVLNGGRLIHKCTFFSGTSKGKLGFFHVKTHRFSFVFNVIIIEFSHRTKKYIYMVCLLKTVNNEFKGRQPRNILSILYI